MRTANDGALGVQAAREFDPDLILLDVIMPDSDGGHVAAQIKEDPMMREAPIVFLTAVVSREETGAHGGVIGGNEFLAKPVSAKEVLACLDHKLDGAAQQ